LQLYTIIDKGENKMTSIIRRGALPARTISKREFLTPFDEIFNTLMGDVFPTLHQEFGTDFFVQGSYPKCNVLNFDDRVEIEAAIPGLSRSDVDVEVIEGVLTIKGESNQQTQSPWYAESKSSNSNAPLFGGLFLTSLKLWD
jgi:HSP20 family molecular chaperone IbpA